MSSVSKATGYTLFDEEKCEFTWKVGSLRFLPQKNGANLVSPIFSTKSGVKFYFKLVTEANIIHPYIFSRNIYLHCKNPVNQLKCDYHASVIEISQQTARRGFAILKVNEESTVQLVFDDEQTIFCSRDTLTVRCELQLSRGSRTTILDSRSIVNDTKATIPKLKFDWVFLDENLSDLKLQTGSGKEIPAHRVVLAAASPVFKAMFSHDMLENKIQSVNITDVDYDVAVEMLRFIYTGSVENEEVSFIIDVLVAADKYQLEELQNKCEEILSSNLSTKNAVDILKAAAKCSMKDLKNNAIDFIKLHINHSSETDDLGDMILSMEQFFS